VSAKAAHVPCRHRHRFRNQCDHQRVDEAFKPIVNPVIALASLREVLHASDAKSKRAYQFQLNTRTYLEGQE